jgi:hypothetical protein
MVMCMNVEMHASACLNAPAMSPVVTSPEAEFSVFWATSFGHTAASNSNLLLLTSFILSMA